MKCQQIIPRRINFSYKTHMMPYILSTLWVYMLYKSKAKVCYKYPMVISIFDFEIYLLNFSQERSGENVPTGRQTNFSRYLSRSLAIACVASRLLWPKYTSGPIIQMAQIRKCHLISSNSNQSSLSWIKQYRLIDIM